MTLNGAFNAPPTPTGCRLPGSGGEHFRVGIAGFDPSAVASKPKSLSVAADVAQDKKAVALRDLDGIKVGSERNGRPLPWPCGRRSRSRLRRRNGRRGGRLQRSLQGKQPHAETLR